MVEAARWRSRARQIAQYVWPPHSVDYLSTLALCKQTRFSFISKLNFQTAEAKLTVSESMHLPVHALWVVLSKCWPFFMWWRWWRFGLALQGDTNCIKFFPRVSTSSVVLTFMFIFWTSQVLLLNYRTTFPNTVSKKIYIHQLLRKNKAQKNPKVTPTKSNHVNATVNKAIIAGWAFLTCQ